MGHTKSRKGPLMFLVYLPLMAAAGMLLAWSNPKYSSVEAADATTRMSTAATNYATGSWTRVASPNLTGYNHQLNGIAVTSVNSAWAVGSYAPGSSGAMPLIEHWNGTEWAVDSQQSNLPTGAILYGVSALSQNDIWAVGSVGGRTLTAHWDGSTWSVVPSPSVANFINILRSVSMVSRKDVWAVGQVGIDSLGPSLILHWDGIQWSIVPSPVRPNWNRNTVLYGVAAVASTNVFAVGSLYFSPSHPNDPLALHWDGTRWQQSGIASVDKLFREYEIRGVSGTGPNDIWAVGGCNGGGPCAAGLTEHWSGRAWSVVSIPPMPHVSNWLYGVTALSAGKAWAVGTSYSTENGTQTLVLRWDGANWTEEESPSPSSAQMNMLSAVASDRSGDLWAVGYEREGTVNRTLILRRNCEVCWTTTQDPPK